MRKHVFVCSFFLVLGLWSSYSLSLSLSFLSASLFLFRSPYTYARYETHYQTVALNSADRLRENLFRRLTLAPASNALFIGRALSFRSVGFSPHFYIL